MIDLSKPIQLSDGTPMQSVTKSIHGSGYAGTPARDVKTSDYTYRGGTGQMGFKEDGKHVGSDLYLQNVPPTFDPSKPVALRDGTSARIICTDAPGPKSIVILVGNSTHRRHPDGRILSYKDSNRDLVNVPERITRYCSMSKLSDVPNKGLLATFVGPALDHCTVDTAHWSGKVLAVTFENDVPISAEVLTR